MFSTSCMYSWYVSDNSKPQSSTKMRVVAASMGMKKQKVKRNLLVTEKKFQHRLEMYFIS